ncbi:hypothetical protein [Oerskovia turbata]
MTAKTPPEAYPPLGCDDSTLTLPPGRRAGSHGPVTSGWLLGVSVGQLGAVIVVLWLGLGAFPEMTAPAVALMALAMASAHWLVTVLVLAVGRARFRCHERRYLAWLDRLPADERERHARRAQHRLLAHEAEPHPSAVPADW